MNQSMQQQSKVGIIGYGYWGPNLVRLLNESTKTSVVYCSDILDSSLTQVAQKYPHIKTTKNYKTIINDKEIDAIFIATPTKTHYKIAKDCLIAKKHVFIEKPLTDNIKEGEELVSLAKKYKRIIAVGHIFLFNPAVRYIKKIIDENTLGTIRYLHFQRKNLGPVRKDVNVLWDLSPHDISMLVYLIKEKPISVYAIGKSFLQNDIEDVVSATLIFENNIMATLLYSWIDPVKVRDITIVGDKKMLLFNDVNVSEKIKIFDKNAKIIENTRGVSFGEYQISLHAGGTTIPSIENKEPLKEELDHFLQCINTNTNPLNDGRHALRVVEIIAALQKSLKNNSKMISI